MRLTFPYIALFLSVACGGAPATRPSLPPPDPAIAQAARAALEAAPELRRGAVVVLDAASGQILARVGRGPLGDGEALRVAAVGSTWKTLTIAAALEAGLDASRRFEDLEGRWGEGAARVEDWQARPWHDARSTLVHSSNVGAAMITDAVGPASLLALVGDLRLADPLVLPEGEVPGLVIPPAPAWNLPVPDWGRLRPEARPWAAGIGIEASLLHVAVAYAAVANDGVTRWPSPDGTGESLRALRATTARAVKAALRAAVAEGTGTRAAVEGVDLGGKTGTALVAEGRAGLFAGFFPPGRVAVVRVEGGPELTGGAAAAPVFADLVRALAQR